MSALGEFFEERLQEILAYLALLENLEDSVQDGTPRIGETAVTAQQQRILYSAVYLQLYNLVEATATRCVNAVSQAAAEGWYPADLSITLRREWVRATARTHTDLNQANRLETAIAFCDLLIAALPVGAWEVERGARGNWDDFAIRSITRRIGLNLRVTRNTLSGVRRPFRDDKGALTLVKDLRNRLAHGDISFSECGDGVTVGDLRDLAQRVAVYLREVVNAFERFIESYGFLLPERRPAV